MTTTDAFGMPPALSRALAAKGYNALTDVQEAMLEPALAERDLLVSAQTGSGKTVAFGLAIADGLLLGDEQLPEASAPLAIAVAPTRELAIQVAKELTWLYAEAGGKVATCVGGMDFRAESQALLRGAHIVVGTPGRLVDHITRGALKLDDLRVVVLDEADEMLNLGFREELETILEACPDERRTLMFSATVGGGIGKLAARYQVDALRISVTGSRRQHDDITYQAMVTAKHDTEKAIINTLRYHEAENAIVFCSTRAAVARLTSRLANRGFSVVSLSGELSQQERTNALQAMRDGRARVCVATDVAARGIDLPGLELVIHADLPKNREGLLHRSGRTGRAGKKGTSVLIVPPQARRRVERLMTEAAVEALWQSPPNADEVRARDGERLLTDPLLTEFIEDDELARQIAETYSADHLAAVIVRMHQATRSAPEELSEVEILSKPKEPQPRRDFADSVWVILTVGRSDRAEPRWLLPMLCKTGSIKKAAIGAIRVREEETYVQLDAEGASDFLARIAEDARIENGIEARVADGPPSAEKRANRPSFKKTGSPARSRRPDAAGEERPKLKRKQKNSAKTKPGTRNVQAEGHASSPKKRTDGSKPRKRKAVRS